MESLPIINQGYEIYKEITGLNEKLTKRWRYTLGVGIENTTLSFLELVIMAKDAPKPLKAPYLIKAGAQLEILRLKLRLMLELGLANETRIFQIQAKLQEIGRMLGGWRKASQ